MSRYQIITDIVLSNIEKKCFGLKKLEGYQHLISVATLMIVIAPKRDLDKEIAGCIGILHDYSTYYTNSSFDHASRSGLFAKEILEQSALFKEAEIITIVTAINNHSQKDNIDDCYSELLKDVDLYHQHIIEPTRIFTTQQLLRIKKIEKEL